jgi:serine/threonine-protein kinase
MAKIGRYEIIEELGKGEMASVFMARDPFIKRHISIKIFAYELTQDPLFLDFFYQVAEAIASLERPTIGPSYDVGLLGVQPYSVRRQMRQGAV